MFDHPNADVIHRHVATRYECDAEEFTKPGVHLEVWYHSDRRLMLTFQHDDYLLIKTSEDLADRIQSWIDERNEESVSFGELADHFAPGRSLGAPTERVLYLHPDRFRSQPAPDVRRLTLDDGHALTDLHRACPMLDQRMANINIDHPAVFGKFTNDELIAVASFIESDFDAIADIGVLVHPDHRRQGNGQAVVSALAEHGLNNNRIVQYWRLDYNSGSANIADRLGFTEYGRQTMLRCEV
ncbi:GNAT family N-acetyltransferase [Thalassoroseus pseudoceratinae]|uniref:GNAT family N-acetyltransferase n=1 Tax=Thalassoroseus pseudoceratinae TaxID=2713176 RepID=UPI00141E406C|nr:GNAT family N-acetyltransferase [Thalassoroseus pseudoceratinae]